MEKLNLLKTWKDKLCSLPLLVSCPSHESALLQEIKCFPFRVRWISPSKAQKTGTQELVHIFQDIHPWQSNTSDISLSFKNLTTISIKRRFKPKSGIVFIRHPVITEWFCILLVKLFTASDPKEERISQLKHQGWAGSAQYGGKLLRIFFLTNTVCTELW